jgi:hypothetical protein
LTAIKFCFAGRQEASLKKLQEIQSPDTNEHNQEKNLMNLDKIEPIVNADTGDLNQEKGSIVVNVGKMETNNNVYNTLIV